MIRNFIFVFLALFLTACSTKFDGFFSQKPNDEMKSKIITILEFMKSRDYEALNEQFINKEFGFYSVRYSRNLDLVVEHIDILDEVDRFIKITEIKSKEVEFDCSYDLDLEYGWKEEGVFVLKKSVDYFEDYEVENREEKRFISNIIKNAYEVVTTSQMIFYIAKYEEKFYIVLIDNARTDCRK